MRKFGILALGCLLLTTGSCGPGEKANDASEIVEQKDLQLRDSLRRKGKNNPLRKESEKLGEKLKNDGGE